MSIHRSFLAAFSIGCFSSSVLAQVTPAEDRTIRQTYARITMATELNATLATSTATPAEITKKMNAAALRYDIVAIRGGDLASLPSDTPISSLVTWTNGPSIQLGIMTTNHTEGKISTKQEGAYALWTTTSEISSVWSSFLLRDAIPKVYALAKRYAEVTLTASLDGKATTYNALFLFAPGQTAYVRDEVSGGLVYYFVNTPVYPYVLLNTQSRFGAGAQFWLKTHEVNGCAVTGKSECCDLSTLKCGVTTEEIKSTQGAIDRTSLPATEYTPAGGVSCTNFNTNALFSGSLVTDANGHITGTHSFLP